MRVSSDAAQGAVRLTSTKNGEETGNMHHIDKQRSIGLLTTMGTKGYSDEIKTETALNVRQRHGLFRGIRQVKGCIHTTIVVKQIEFELHLQ